jgi:hypothetical protein
VVCFTPQTPHTTALSGKLLYTNPLLHTESIGYVEEESHRAGERIEGTWEPGEKNEL